MSFTLHRTTATAAHTGDAKIQRIAESWLDGDTDATHWLASVADEVVVAPGTTIGGGRFAYVLLDVDTTCRFVARGVAPVTVDEPARVLVLAEAELTEAVRRFPALTDAWAASLARCAAAA